MSADKCLPEIFADTTDFWTILCCRRRSDTDDVALGSLGHKSSEETLHVGSSLSSSSSMEYVEQAVRGTSPIVGSGGSNVAGKSLSIIGDEVVKIFESSPDAESVLYSPEILANTEINARIMSPTSQRLKDLRADESSTGRGRRESSKSRSTVDSKMNDAAAAVSPSPWASVLFFLGISTLLCYFLEGDIEMLTDMYSLAFLLVMALFAACGLWMKWNRPTLPRKHEAAPEWFIAGFLCVLVAFLGALLKNQPVMFYFALFYVITIALVMSTYYRVWLITAAGRFLESLGWQSASVGFFEQYKRIRRQGVVFFTKTANLSQLNQVLLYIFANEDTAWVRIVHCYENEIPRHLQEYVALLDCMYPLVRIDLVLVHYDFGPAVIPYLSKKLLIPANCMFITCPTANFKHRLDTLGGVRVILNDGELGPGVIWGRASGEEEVPGSTSPAKLREGMHSSNSLVVHQGSEAVEGGRASRSHGAFMFPHSALEMGRLSFENGRFRGDGYSPLLPESSGPY